MSSKHETSRLSVEVPVNIHKQLKAMAALNGVSVKQLVLYCLGELLFNPDVPNKETLKAFEETDLGEGLITCEDVGDLFDKLGLNE